MVNGSMFNVLKVINFHKEKRVLMIFESNSFLCFRCHIIYGGKNRKFLDEIDDVFYGLKF